MMSEFPAGGRSPEELRERLVQHASRIWWFIYFPTTAVFGITRSLAEGMRVSPFMIPLVALAVAHALMLTRKAPWRLRAKILVFGATALWTAGLMSAGPTMTVGALALTALLWTAMFFGVRALIALSCLLAALYWVVATAMMTGVLQSPSSEFFLYGTFTPWLRIFVYSSLIIPPLTASVQVLVISFEESFARERRAREEERARRDELDRATHELEVAQQRELAGALASGLVHDMRNSLHVIGLNAEYLRGRVQGEDRVTVEHLKQAADQTQQILRDLVEFAGKQPDEAPEADVRLVADRVGQLVARVLPANVKLVVQCECDGRVGMRGGRLAQALVNLVLNAMDAMPSGGTITLRIAKAGASTIQITVADGGIGMSSETLEHLFDPYFTTKPAGKGTGLGLFMVQRAVRDADGTVAVHSVAGQGTTFTLTLPRAS